MTGRRSPLAVQRAPILDGTVDSRAETQEPNLRALCALVGGEPVAAAEAHALPAVPGAYLLLVRLATPLALTIGTLPPAILLPGWYLYAGSARGPGGIRARVARHLRRDKRVNWHVDRLTGAAAEIRACAAPGAAECDLVAALLARPGVEAPVAGFGSSDCRTCPSHLLALVAKT